MSPRNYSFEEIKKLIVDKIGCVEEEVTLTCDINKDLGCYGDDFDELILTVSHKVCK